MNALGRQKKQTQNKPNSKSFQYPNIISTMLIFHQKQINWSSANPFLVVMGWAWLLKAKI